MLISHFMLITLCMLITHCSLITCCVLITQAGRTDQTAATVLADGQYQQLIMWAAFYNNLCWLKRNFILGLIKHVTHAGGRVNICILSKKIQVWHSSAWSSLIYLAAYVYLVDLIYPNDLLDDTTSLLSTNQGSWFCLGRSVDLPAGRKCMEVVHTT